MNKNERNNPSGYRRRTPAWFWPALISGLLAIVLFFLVMVLVPGLSDSFISGSIPGKDVASNQGTEPIVTRMQTTPTLTEPTESPTTTTAAEPMPTPEASESELEAVPTPEPTSSPTPEPTPEPTEPFQLIGSPATGYIKKAVERAKPAIVTIYVSMPERGDTPERAALFSGVVIDDKGRIVTPISNLSFALTYNGVFHESAVALAYLPDESEPFALEMIEYDRNTDVALLQLVEPPDSLTPISFATEPVLHLGDFLVALGGSEIGMTDLTLSVGYLTGNMRRTYFEDGLEMGMIQTSAFVTPIMSGAALLDTDGHLIGLINSNVAKDYSDIMGYALPVDILLDVVKRLENKEPPSLVRRVRLGVRVMDSDEYGKIAASRNYPDGLLIAEILPDGPAASSDMQTNDVIISIDGESVDSLERLNALLSKRQVGERAMITLYRTETRRYFTTTVYLRELRD